MGEVDDDISADERLTRITDVDLRGQLQVSGGLDRAARLRSHPPPGAEYPNLDHRVPSLAAPALATAGP
jgi:hypothetical protein